MTSIVPLLFGIDPDETWEFVPEVARAAGQSKSSFSLKAPSLSLATKREHLLSTKAAEIRAAVPGLADQISEFFGKDWKLPADADESLKAQFIDLIGRWTRAWSDASKAHEKEEQAIDAEYLSTCVVGWDGLPSRSGKLLEFDRLKDRIPEVIRGALREEIIGAISKGATLTAEEHEGLPSTPAS
jgi:hypothetical protein